MVLKIRIPLNDLFSIEQKYANKKSEEDFLFPRMSMRLKYFRHKVLHSFVFFFFEAVYSHWFYLIISRVVWPQELPCLSVFTDFLTKKSNFRSDLSPLIFICHLLMSQSELLKLFF